MELPKIITNKKGIYDTPDKKEIGDILYARKYIIVGFGITSR